MTLSCRPCHSRVLLQGHSHGHMWSYHRLSLCKYRRGRLEVMYLWENAITDIFYICKNHNMLFVSLFLCNFLQSQYINFRTPISKPDCRCVCQTPALITSRVLRVLSQEVGLHRTLCVSASGIAIASHYTCLTPRCGVGHIVNGLGNPVTTGAHRLYIRTCIL